LRQGKSLETLIEQLERSLAKSENVTVSAPKRLRDRITGRLREHDVVLTVNQGHHEVLIAIECRDRSRPITVNQVEGFWAKCQDTGIDQGIIVSTKGFYKSAMIKATERRIRCLDLEYAKSLNWFLAKGIEIHTKEIRNIHWTLILVGEPEVSPTDFSIIDKNGAEISLAVLNNNAKREVSNLPDDPSVSGIQRARIVFSCEKTWVYDKSTDNSIPLKELIAEIEYEVKKEYAPFDFLTYSDSVNNQGITDAALVPIDMGDLKGKLMFVGKADKGLVLTFIPDEKKS
jgi:hypothetical protein